MIIAKFVLFASPLIIASILFLANPAAAFPISSASATTDVNSSAAQTVHGLATLNQVNESNPILDHLTCKCSYCAGAKSQLQGKLPFSNF
ncbi:MAG: hypothetical protein AAF757_03690 [Cyanobacteria bacterium P01_D01_bin.116]